MIINKETFADEDIKFYKLYNLIFENDIYNIQTKNIPKLIQYNNLSDNFKINFPDKLLSYLIYNHPNKTIYNYLDDFVINIKSFEDAKIKETYWTKHTDYIGIYNKGTFNLFLRHENISIVALCWIVLHELRHHIQYKNSHIESCLDNSNFKLLKKAIIDKFKISENTFNHVFHEILPYEIDANTFACEILKIDYPNSKFSVTPESLNFLEGID